MSQKLYFFILIFLAGSAIIPLLKNKVLNEGVDVVALPGMNSHKIPGWRIQLQPGWKRVEKHAHKNSHIFSSPERSKGAIVVKTESWEGSDALYGSQKLNAVKSSNENQIINSGPLMISDSFGVIYLYSTSTFIIFEISVALRGVGYTVQCSGKFNSVDEAATICEQQLSTFRLLN